MTGMTAQDETRYRAYLDLLRTDGSRYALRERHVGAGYRLLFCCRDCEAEFDVTSTKGGVSHRDAVAALEHVRAHGDAA